MFECIFGENVFWEVETVGLTHSSNEDNIFSRMFFMSCEYKFIRFDLDGIKKLREILFCDEKYKKFLQCCLLELMVSCEVLCENEMVRKNVIDDFISVFDDTYSSCDKIDLNKLLLYIGLLTSIYRPHDIYYAGFIDSVVAGILLYDSGYYFGRTLYEMGMAGEMYDSYVLLQYVFLDLLNTMFLKAKEKIEKDID